MRTGLNSRAFTLIEVMLTLSISMGLFGMLATIINGQQSKTEFVQSVNAFQSRLMDIANDVATGNNPTNTNYVCTHDGTAANAVIIDYAPPTASDRRGTSEGCLFVGIGMQFTEGSPRYDVFALVGKKDTDISGVKRPAKSLYEAQTWPIIDVNNLGSISESLSYGVVVRSVSYINSSGTFIRLNGLGFTTTFANSSGASLVSGDAQTDIIPAEPIIWDPFGNGTTPLLPYGEWRKTLDASSGRDSTKNPSSGIKICLENSETGPDRRAYVTVGGNGRQSSVTVQFADGACL